MIKIMRMGVKVKMKVMVIVVMAMIIMTIITDDNALIIICNVLIMKVMITAMIITE